MECVLCNKKLKEKDAVKVQTPNGGVYICRKCAIAEGIIEGMRQIFYQKLNKNPKRNL